MLARVGAIPLTLVSAKPGCRDVVIAAAIRAISCSRVAFCDPELQPQSPSDNRSLNDLQDAIRGAQEKGYADAEDRTDERQQDSH